ncbi:ABC transporter permease subunit [Tolypothrix sp. FACHB-123]|uniref:ABC transporter permease n=1 Tax=Tolypothrix sp. FACHB-123 TaxID=2692868 RepID=UPI001688C93D|nr:ABC transporter permease [Tolypothrix sp. FACHB-123]MBD2356809.1 ABC transporter permease subunit [Tolypothrix sp. FACHB-123]
MTFNLIDKLGEWNPQLFRELKGRLKVFNILIALAISLLTQLGVYVYQFSDFPTKTYPMSGTYCKLSQGYQLQFNAVNQTIDQIQQKINLYSGRKNYDLAKIQQLKEQLQSLKSQHSQLDKLLYQSYCPPEKLNMQLWWQEHWQHIYVTLSVMFVFTLLVAGTYLLIANLAQEDRRGTLNFIRLSPQPEKTILTGKMLGVPVLIYLIILAAIPLNLWAGISANIPVVSILSFYLVLIASCIFFYSNALLFGLISRFFSGFQPWLGSGLVLLFLFICLQSWNYSSGEWHNTATWLRLLSPFDMIGYGLPKKDESSLRELQFFYIPVGKNLVGLVGIYLFNYGVGIYWAWQGMKRRFRNPEGAMINKVQSYFLVASYQVIFWGFTLQYHKNYLPNYSNIATYYDVNHQIGSNFLFIAFFNIVLLFALLAILSPHRQTIQDWARYRHQNTPNMRDISDEFLLKDWVVDEKSPSLLAMLINLAIATTPLIVWIVIAPMLNIHHNNAVDWVNSLGRFKSILGVVLCISLMMIYTTLAQLLLLMKTPRRSLWAAGVVGATIILPPMFLGLSGITLTNNPEAWLFFNFPWSLENSAMMGIFTSLIANLSVIMLLNIQLTKQINLAGESATKALLAGRK